jgi:hypothetical protein
LEKLLENFGSITFGMGNSSKFLSLHDANIRHIHTSFPDFQKVPLHC